MKPTYRPYAKFICFAVCSAEFGGVDGVITSPGYPGNYDNNLSCYFSIKAPPGVSIEITFLEFLLEPQSDCLFDRLEVELHVLVHL